MRANSHVIALIKPGSGRIFSEGVTLGKMGAIVNACFNHVNAVFA